MAQRLIPLFALLLVIFGFATAQQDEHPLLYFADFEDMRLPPQLQVIGGEPTLAGGSLILSGTGTQLVRFASSPAWTDYALEVDIRITSGQVRLGARASGEGLCAGYFFSASAVRGRYELARGTRSCGVLLYSAQNASIPLDTTLTLSIEAEGDAIRTTVYGETLLSVRDDAYTSGPPIIAVIAEDEPSRVAIEAIRVVALGESVMALTQTSEPPFTPSLTATHTATPTMTATVTPMPTDTPAPTDTTTPTDTVTPTDTATPTDTPAPTDTATPTATPLTTLAHYADGPEAALAELQAGGLVTEGGTMQFEENFAAINRTGNWFVSLEGVGSNVVVAGELTLYNAAGGRTQNCALSLRVRKLRNGTAVTYVDVGINSRGEVYISDRFYRGQAPIHSDFQNLRLASGRAVHILAVAVGEELTVFVDGERVFDRAPVWERIGAFGFAMESGGPGARCELRNAWGYRFD